MALNLTSRLDGTGRTPRQVQLDALRWVEDNWSGQKHLALSLPVGAGKSLIARAIQLATNAAIVTPSNTLVRQYSETYPDLAYSIGKSNYRCEDRSVKCSDLMDKHHLTPCQNCPYKKARDAEAAAQPCLYNPISLFQARKQDNFVPHSVVVVDEAHAVLALLYTLNSEKITFDPRKLSELYDIQDETDLQNEHYLLKFLVKELALRKEDQERFEHTWSIQTKGRREKRLAALENIIYGMSLEPHQYAVSLDRGSVVIRCVKLPKAILKRVFGPARLILLSATLFAPDLSELLQGEPYEYLDLPSPIPRDRRPVFYTPTPYKINYQTNPADLAKSIEAVLAGYPGVNTLVHIPYSLAHRVAANMKTKVITHTSDNKDERLQYWTTNGGVLIGSGMYEGLDLKEDLCRLNIIVKIPYPNLSDIIVRKRRALKDGELWYASESLKGVVQAAGRSTRTEDDYSETYVLDPTFAKLVSKNQKWLPLSFTSSIIWSQQDVNRTSSLPTEIRGSEALGVQGHSGN